MTTIQSIEEILDKISIGITGGGIVELAGDIELRGIPEALSQLEKLYTDRVVEMLPEKKTKDPSNYINEPTLRAWQDGYNQCLADIRAKLGEK